MGLFKLSTQVDVLESSIVNTDTCIQEAEAEEQAQKLIDQFHKENPGLDQYAPNVPPFPNKQVANQFPLATNSDYQTSQPITPMYPTRTR